MSEKLGVLERLYNWLVAKFTGDYDEIVSDFNKVADRLERHGKRKVAIANQQTQQATKLTASASAHYEGAIKANATAQKIRSIVS